MANYSYKQQNVYYLVLNQKTECLKTRVQQFIVCTRLLGIFYIIENYSYQIESELHSRNLVHAILIVF